jgi:hypothetical protein
MMMHGGEQTRNSVSTYDEANDDEKGCNTSQRACSDCND